MKKIIKIFLVLCVITLISGCVDDKAEGYTDQDVAWLHNTTDNLRILDKDINILTNDEYNASVVQNFSIHVQKAADDNKQFNTTKFAPAQKEWTSALEEFRMASAGEYDAMTRGYYSEMEVTTFQNAYRHGISHLDNFTNELNVTIN